MASPTVGSQSFGEGSQPVPVCEPDHFSPEWGGSDDGRAEDNPEDAGSPQIAEVACKLERWKGKQPTDAEVLKEVEKIGVGKFPVEDWMNLIQLRCCLEPELAKVLRTCQFEACASRVRVRPGDFALVSELHADVPWVKVAILLQKYIGTLHEKFPTVEKGGKKRPCIAFTERETEVAQKLSITCMAQLRQEVQLQKAIENRYICDLRVGEPPHRLRPVTLH